MGRREHNAKAIGCGHMTPKPQAGIALFLPAAVALVAVVVAFTATPETETNDLPVVLDDGQVVVDFTATPETETKDLLVVLDDGQVVVVTPDGAGARPLTELPSGTTAFQPIWSPDGRVVAYAENGSDSAALVTLEVQGGAVGRIELPAPAFYYYFSPTASSIAWLRNDATAGLVLETGSAGGHTVVDGGAPFYFAWAPEGDEIAAHVGTDRMDVLASGRRPMTIEERPGGFLAPWWTDHGVFYIRSRSTGQELVVDSGDDVLIIARVVGPANLAVAGSRVAVQTFGSREGGVAASFQQTPNIDPGTLSVIDVGTLTVDEVVPRNVIAFFWDPDGTRLLFLEVVDRETGRFAWTVWNGDGLEPFGEFVIDVSWLRDFLPFFDQYAQSMTLWSPDGTAFAFPGTIGSRSGIWVQELAEPEPTWVSPGTWVAWSPDGSAR